MRAQVRAEILRSKVFAKEALAEEDRIADWQLGLPDPNAPAGSVVYFARRHPWCVKIGFSADKNKRMREIADNALVGMSAGPVKLLATIPGARPKEHALHQRFRHLHIGKEWFLLNDELRRFIRGIGEQPVSAP